MPLISVIKNIENTFRIYFPKRLKDHRNISKLLFNKKGIEIGGPTSNFERKGFLPIYQNISNLDNVNFSNKTVWEGDLIEGSNFKFGNKIGKQFIKEASDLTGISYSQYDFLISSHNIEHLANPLKTIQEWKRVVKPNGLFLWIVPNKEGTFDHRRPITNIEHLIKDLEYNTGEEDETHFDEILELHDLTKDPGGLDFIDFKNRTLNNFENRCVHHHVFNIDLLKNIADFSHIEILRLDKFSKMHLILFGKNLK
jgi:SAM-dependent methyltransferase